MDYQNQQRNVQDVLNIVSTLFRDVMNEDAIHAVLESCGGDLNNTVEAIMDITRDSGTTLDITRDSGTTLDITRDSGTTLDSTTISESSQVVPGDTSMKNQVDETLEANTVPTPLLSYVRTAMDKGAVPKIKQPEKVPNKGFWSDQFRRIIKYHNQGSRIAIIMRGVPGSGKTHLAKQIVEVTIGNSVIDFKTHICSTDDYFICRGVYRYDIQQLSDAHLWNQRRSSAAMKQGLSPIIIDNTNIEIWEMQPYVHEAVKNGYIIEILEPNTPWARKLNHLVKRNTHNVPVSKIKKMLENYQSGITGDFLLKYFGYLYPPSLVPPVMRIIPEPVCRSQTTGVGDSLVNVDTHNRCHLDLNKSIQLSVSEQIIEQNIAEDNQKLNKDLINFTENNSNATRPSSDKKAIVDETQVQSVIEEADNSCDLIDTDETKPDLEKQNFFISIQKQLEEMSKVEEDWENGESWTDNTKEDKTNSHKIASLNPKPPRINNSDSKNSSNILTSYKLVDDWKLPMFVPQSYDELPLQSNIVIKNVETHSSGTCIDIGDADITNTQNVYKVITATPRDINKFHVSLDKEKIPVKRMLDKSSMTDEESIRESYKCKNEEKHFNIFRKLFKNIPRSMLRDIFDNCCGDLNWAVDIVLDGVTTEQLKIKETDEVSDTESDNQDQCDCFVTPDNRTSDAGPNTEIVIPILNTKPPISSRSILNSQKKVKKDKRAHHSHEMSLQLKHLLEHNVVISDHHYSKHCLKIRKMRHGENNEILNDAEKIPPLKSDKGNLFDMQSSVCESNTSRGFTMTAVNVEESDEESVASDDVEKTINVNLGMDFISQLDEIFGMKDLMYPENIQPKINIPVSLLNELYALWLESLMNQIDEQTKQSEIMLKQDEEFARMLMMKEQELAQAGKEPEVPDLKEIMDMDLALSLYHKNVADWRNDEPKDLAAKLSRDKLFNLFPEVPSDVLSELLMAHGNDFQTTVEVLLMSTGREEILQQEKGLSKFVMEKEIQRQEKILEEEKKSLCEEEWPSLPKGEQVDMSTVNSYRAEAEKHLRSRDMHYQKAQEYISRGMTQVANYCSDVAAYHKRMYEQSCNLAAASLVQMHANKCKDNATIDLHFLRVAEAKEALDMFLDSHIKALRESQTRGGPRSHRLYFITGRGLHSSGGPRVKPAVKRRLRERGLSYCERNPGLLSIRITCDHKLTHQLPPA